VLEHSRGLDQGIEPRGQTKVPAAHDARQIGAMLRLPEIEQLIADLGETRWTGRPRLSSGTPASTAIGPLSHRRKPRRQASPPIRMSVPSPSRLTQNLACQISA
jgi:hypothetical protein